MTLFFPDSTSNVKINASNSQVTVSVGETMTISAGDTFTVGAGSTASIKIGPSASFSLGTSLEMSLAAKTSYTYGRNAGFGLTSTQTNQTSTQNAATSYTIKAGSDTTLVKQTLNLTKLAQVGVVLGATIVSMGAIAVAVVGGLSSPIFVKDTVDTSATANAVVNSNSSDVARAACAMAITTTMVFAAQWLLTYILTNSSEFKPVCTLDMNKTGFTATVQMEGQSTPSVETILHAVSSNPDPVGNPNFDPKNSAMLTQRVNQVATSGKSLQLSEIILNTNKVAINSTAQKDDGTVTNNTQITLDSANKEISLKSDSAAVINGGDIVIGKNTAITNPAGDITLSSKSGTIDAGLLLNASTPRVSLSCTNNNEGGYVSASPDKLDIGFDTTSNVVFDKTGTTISGKSIKLSSAGTVMISGASINLGNGALTIVGQADGQSNTALATILEGIKSATTAKESSDKKFLELQNEMKSLQDAMLLAKNATDTQIEALNAQLLALKI